MAGNGNGEVMTMPVVVSQCNPPWGLYGDFSNTFRRMDLYEAQLVQ